LRFRPRGDSGRPADRRPLRCAGALCLSAAAGLACERPQTDDTRPVTSGDRGDSAVAVTREAADAAAGLEAALRELLRGPTPTERAAGLHSWFSDTTSDALRSASIDERGRATVDFADLRALIPNASTSAGSALLLSELNATVFSVPAVQSVEYRIEGSCAVFWEWLQYQCEVVPRP
jgi:hypothetical protein